MKILTYLLLLITFVSSCKEPTDKFIGVWKDPNMKGDNLNQISISKIGKNQVLVEYKRRIDVGMYGNKLYDKNGSFKEVGTIDGNIIQVNQYVKLSLIENDNKILLNSQEFIKDESVVLYGDPKEDYNSTSSNEEKPKIKEKRIQDSIEAAMRFSDSLAALEASLLEEDGTSQISIDRGRITTDNNKIKVKFIIENEYLVITVNSRKFRITKEYPGDITQPNEGELALCLGQGANSVSGISAFFNKNGDIIVKEFYSNARYGGDSEKVLLTIKKEDFN
jgi:hypothetical protein